MPKKRNLSVEVRSSVVTLSEEGYSQRALAARQKVSLCAVQNILTKKKETGSVRDKPDLADLSRQVAVKTSYW